MIILSDLTGNIMQGYMSTIIKLIMYVAVAAIGITLGVRLRKRKDNRESK